MVMVVDAIEKGAEMNTRTWSRRLSKIQFPDPMDEARGAWLDAALRRLSPSEREEMADLRERLGDGGLGGLTAAERDRLKQLAAIIHGDSRHLAEEHTR